MLLVSLISKPDIKRVLTQRRSLFCTHRERELWTSLRKVCSKYLYILTLSLLIDQDCMIFQNIFFIYENKRLNRNEYLCIHVKNTDIS